MLIYCTCLIFTARAQALFEQIGPLAAPAGGREQSNPAIKVRELFTT